MIIGVLLLLLALIAIWVVYKVVAAYKSRKIQTATGLGGVNQFDDFVNNVTGSVYTSYKTNGGSVFQIPLSSRSTLIRLHNNSATDVAGISAVDPNGNGCIVVAQGTSTSIASEVRVDGSVITPATTFIFGFAQLQNPKANPGIDAYLMFDRSVSNNWVCVRKNGTTTVQTVTSIPVTLDASGGSVYTFVTLKVITTLFQSLYYVNGVLIATVTQDWSAISNPAIGPVAVLSSSGTADIANVFMDYMWLIHNFATVRATP